MVRITLPSVRGVAITLMIRLTIGAVTMHRETQSIRRLMRNKAIRKQDLALSSAGDVIGNRRLMRKVGTAKRRSLDLRAREEVLRSGHLKCVDGPFSGRARAVMQFLDGSYTNLLFGVISLRRQMSKFKMDVDHVVLIDSAGKHFKEMQEALCEIGVDRVVPVDGYIQSIVKDCDYCRKTNFNKLFAFNQSTLGYKRAVSIDCDIFAAQPFDDIFNYQGVAMTHWLQMEYNSGVVVFEPDTALFNKMMDALKLRMDRERKKKVQDKDPLRINDGDQGFLQAFLMNGLGGTYQLNELPNSFNVRAVSFGETATNYASKYHKNQLKLIHFSMKPYRDQKIITEMWKEGDVQNEYMCDFIASVADHLREHPQLATLPEIGPELRSWREFLHIQDTPQFGDWIDSNCANRNL